MFMCICVCVHVDNTILVLSSLYLQSFLFVFIFSLHLSSVLRENRNWWANEGPNTHMHSQKNRNKMDWHTVVNRLTRLLHACLSSSLTAAWLLDYIQQFCKAALRAVRPSVELAVSSSFPPWWQMTCVSRSDTGSRGGGGVREGLIV